MGNKKEKLIALCKSPGYCVQAHVPPPREEVQERKEGQRRAVAVIGSRKGEQISNQREGDSQGLCNTSLELGRAVPSILSHEDRGVESQQRKCACTQSLDCGTGFHRKWLKPRMSRGKVTGCYSQHREQPELGVNVNEHCQEMGWGGKAVGITGSPGGDRHHLSSCREFLDISALCLVSLEMGFGWME